MAKPKNSTKPKLRILIIGAHPDDCEVTAAGTAALWSAAGHTVRFVSTTNGATGHHLIGGIDLVKRRQAESRKSGRILKVQYEIMNNTNGDLEASLTIRKSVMIMIRKFNPDLVLTHRPNDYHPDHRYTSQLVQDSAYVVTVPNNVPTVPALRTNPIMGYLSDRFQKPIPFQPDVVIGIDQTIEKKLDALHAHTSQMYEWLPYSTQTEDQVPESDKDRREWLRETRLKADAERAERYRDKLIERYGKRKGMKIKYAEAFEACEYGSPMTDEQIKRLFPF